MKKDFHRILEQIAVANQTTAEQVWEEMQIALDIALNNNDPVIRRYLERIPKEGDKLTPEEFVHYIARQIVSGQL